MKTIKFVSCSGKWARTILLLLIATVMCLAFCRPVLADSVNPDTGYVQFIYDQAGLLTDDQYAQLEERMQPLTDYGNIALVTLSTNEYSSTRSFAENFYYQSFGNASGSLLVIDMDNRMIYIASDGANYRIITKGRADTITDNIYRYASREDYYGCAAEAFDEMHDILRGNRIAQPMKYICNAILAILLGLLISFILVLRASRLRKANVDVLINAAQAEFSATPANVTQTGQTKVYSPVESSSGGGGGHSGGGGFSGGGGGGFSGGGGGHRF